MKVFTFALTKTQRQHGDLSRIFANNARKNIKTFKIG
jgi:hypothetical protein